MQGLQAATEESFGKTDGTSASSDMALNFDVCCAGIVLLKNAEVASTGRKLLPLNPLLLRKASLLPAIHSIPSSMLHPISLPLLHSDSIISPAKLGVPAVDQVHEL